ncbi:MAG: hypothetical protein JO053_16220 [Acidobacteria bacterium]|nr:hypothetical protein [Acidobacteriota bacterium]
MPKNAVNGHFDGCEDNVREIYETVKAAAREFGPVVEDPKKTSIHLNRRSAFAGVATRRRHLILTLKSISDIESTRIHKRQQASARRWYHEIKLEDTGQVDAELLGWLKDSYELSA